MLHFSSLRFVDLWNWKKVHFPYKYSQKLTHTLACLYVRLLMISDRSLNNSRQTPDPIRRILRDLYHGKFFLVRTKFLRCDLRVLSNLRKNPRFLSFALSNVTGETTKGIYLFDFYFWSRKKTLGNH